MQGVQVYEVFSAPNSSTGLPANLSGNNYFGVFAAKSNVTNATFSLEIQGVSSSYVVYGRSRNDNQTWSVLPSVPSANGVIISSISNRMEVMVDTLQCSVNVTDTLNCPLSSDYIVPNPLHPSVTYTWNNGVVADSIQVGSLTGGVTVVADSMRCVSTDSTFINRQFNVNVLSMDTLFCPLPTDWIAPDPYFSNVSYTWNGGVVADSIQAMNLTGWIKLMLIV